MASDAFVSIPSEGVQCNYFELEDGGELTTQTDDADSNGESIFGVKKMDQWIESSVTDQKRSEMIHCHDRRGRLGGTTRSLTAPVAIFSSTLPSRIS